jgi:hypothetical protein
MLDAERDPRHKVDHNRIATTLEELGLPPGRRTGESLRSWEKEF